MSGFGEGGDSKTTFFFHATPFISLGLQLGFYEDRLK